MRLLIPWRKKSNSQGNCVEVALIEIDEES